MNDYLKDSRYMLTYATHCQREWEIECGYAENRPVWFLHHHGQAAIYSLWHISLSRSQYQLKSFSGDDFCLASIDIALWHISNELQIYVWETAHVSAEPSNKFIEESISL